VHRDNDNVIIKPRRGNSSPTLSRRSETLAPARDDRRAPRYTPRRSEAVPMAALLQRVELIKAKTRARDADPWRAKLARLRGTIGNDGLERANTAVIYDFLQVPPRSRGTPANRRLCSLLTELGWVATRITGSNCGGRKDRVRGYVRHPPSSDLSAHSTD
jgi:hypothetical protein